LFFLFPRDRWYRAGTRLPSVRIVIPSGVGDEDIAVDVVEGDGD